MEHQRISAYFCPPARENFRSSWLKNVFKNVLTLLPSLYYKRRSTAITRMLFYEKTNKAHN
jgi:hypothetical protein